MGLILKLSIKFYIYCSLTKRNLSVKYIYYKFDNKKLIELCENKPIGALSRKFFADEKDKVFIA